MNNKNTDRSSKEKKAGLTEERGIKIVNIQIFGTKKCFDTKKAQRYFKERGIKFQFIDMKEKGMSRGEFSSVCRAVGGISELVDQKCKDRTLLALINATPDQLKESKILENQEIIRTPVVRNGRDATVGFCPEIWKTWQ